ncbi:MAG: SUMF1/EgtB/PvdO family nonheme iron enzyme [Bacteroidales bacterium]|nr:SUMF1/EgtB/PvdO family nonheme iron enzyme [Bacteroidales bacterium]
MDSSTTLPYARLLQGGKYRITGVLGKGGFGITYEAEQVSLHRKVAVKEFAMAPGTDPDLCASFKEKFSREATLIASLNHPHIVRILELFEENDTRYYVMEYLGGGSLDDKVRTGGPLTEQEAVKYIRDIGSALSYLHERGIRHLDVKPANIMFDSDGEVKLIDFGISKYYRPDGSPTSTTPTGYSRGFAPREQYLGVDASQFTPATDIYSLGATLFYLLTGNVPPEALLLDEKPLEIPSGISAPVADAIQKAMSPRRQDRPQDVASLLRLLDSKPDDRTVIRSTDADKTLISAVRKRKKKVWPWIAALLVLLAAGSAAWYYLLRRPDAVEEEEVVMKDDEEIGTIPEDPETPYIEIATSPSGASIWIDGEDTGRKTVEGRSIILTATDGLEAGKDIVFTFKKEGYEDFTAKPLRIVEGKNDPRYAELKVRTDKLAKDGMDYILTLRGANYRLQEVPGGSFSMGATEEQTRFSSDERTIRSVSLSTFFIGSTEVTEALWKVVTGKAVSSHGQFPVTGVTWNDCDLFIKELNSLTKNLRPEGWRFALPTEAQWEFAARGGTSGGTVYSGSDTYEDVAGDILHPVASFKPNRLGIYDMSGNVQEWCSDWYGAYNPADTDNPAGPSGGVARVVRGGSHSSGFAYARVSCRSNGDPSSKYTDVGFRIVLVAQ